MMDHRKKQLRLGVGCIYIEVGMEYVCTACCCLERRPTEPVYYSHNFIYICIGVLLQLHCCEFFLESLACMLL